METSSKWIIAGIIVFVIWLVWDDVSAWFNGPEEEKRREDEFVFFNQEEDYKNIKRFIAGATTQEMADAAFQLIIIFQNEYTGLEAERKASNMISLWETRQELMLHLN